MEFLSRGLQPLSFLSSASPYIHTLDRLCMSVELCIGRNEVGRNLKNRNSIIKNLPDVVSIFSRAENTDSSL
jgi:hypothetical protein